MAAKADHRFSSKNNPGWRCLRCCSNCLEESSIRPYVTSIDTWPNDWAASPRFTDGRARFRPFSKIDEPGQWRRSTSRAWSHVHTVSERTTHDEEGNCEVV